MKDNSTCTLNDSDIGYLDDFFVEEVKKEIKQTLLTFRDDDCMECEVEFVDKQGVFVCLNCGKKIKV
jgi:hypothetical protein